MPHTLHKAVVCGLGEELSSSFLLLILSTVHLTHNISLVYSEYEQTNNSTITSAGTTPIGESLFVLLSR